MSWLRDGTDPSSKVCVKIVSESLKVEDESQEGECVCAWYEKLGDGGIQATPGGFNEFTQWR